MSEETLHDIKLVIEIVGDSSHNVQGEMWGINEFLAGGWILLKVLTGAVPSDHGPAERPRYILGLPTAEEPWLSLAERIRNLP